MAYIHHMNQSRGEKVVQRDIICTVIYTEGYKNVQRDNNICIIPLQR